MSSWYLLRREFCKESRETFRFLVALLVPRPPFFTGNLSYYCVLVMYPLVLFTEKNTPSVPRCPINLPPFNFEFMLDACGTLVLRLLPHFRLRDHQDLGDLRDRRAACPSVLKFSSLSHSIPIRCKIRLRTKRRQEVGFSRGPH